jgi:hypothetical protein
LFDFRLVDHALFQFKSFSEDDVSYCYYEAPFEVVTYRDYVAELFGHDLVAVANVGDSFYEDYELVVETAPLRKAVSPIRYDYQPAQYEPGVHPAAHIHLGTSNEIRLSTGRRMRPTSFVLFVLRQMYPEYWRRFLGRDDVQTVCRSVREDLEQVDEAYMQDRDRLQLILE